MESFQDKVDKIKEEVTTPEEAKKLIEELAGSSGDEELKQALESEGDVFDKYDSVLAWGRKQGLADIEGKIHGIIGAGRLKFINEDKVEYTDRGGRKKKYSFAEVIDEFIKVGDWAAQMDTLTISKQDIRAMLDKEYEKVKR